MTRNNITAVKIDPDARYLILIRGEISQQELNKICKELQKWWDDPDDKLCIVNYFGDYMIHVERVD